MADKDFQAMDDNEKAAEFERMLAKGRQYRGSSDFSMWFAVRTEPGAQKPQRGIGRFCQHRIVPHFPSGSGVALAV